MSITPSYLALKASAGSGKTFILSVRYIALVLDGVSPKSITALTFTKKAASEMSGRIVQTFLELHTSERDAERQALAKLLQCSESEILALRDERLDEFLNANLKITTFDAFFALILRLFSLNLGISPDYKSTSAVSENLYEIFIEQCSKQPALLRSMAHYIVDFNISKRAFFEMIAGLYESVGEQNFPQHQIPSDHDVMQIVRWFEGEIGANENASKDAKNAFAVKSVDELLSKNFWKDSSGNLRESLNFRTFSKIYTSNFDIKFNELKEKIGVYIKNLELFKLGELGKFLKIYKQTRLELASELNELSFYDATTMVHELLTKSESRAMLYFRLDSTIDHLLIDEFQDTNVAQYEIIKPLVEEIVAGVGQNGVGSFFYVGDTKQSIYRFRGGKKELFERLRGEFRHIQSDSLKENYRSAKNLVDYVNETFQNIQNYDYEPQKPKHNNDGYIQICQSDDLVGECVKKTQFLLENGANDSEICILCWKNDDVRKICDALNAVGVSAKDEGAMLLRNSPSVFALVNYAKFCLSGDRLYLQNALVFLGEKFNFKNLTKLTLDPKKTAQQSLLYLALKAGISMQNLDILRLIELAQGYASIVDFLFDFENLDANVAHVGSGGVSVMTTHKSKGLEFKHVILCDKFGKDGGDRGAFLYELDETNGWQIHLKMPNRELFDSDYANFKSYIAKLEREEEINKLYVAMTRAKNSLIIIKQASPSGNLPSYFSQYKSNGKDICYLDLELLETGTIERSSKIQIQTKNVRKIDLVSVGSDQSTGSDVDSEKNLAAIYLGTALHFLLEMCGELSLEGVKNASLAMRNKFAKILDSQTLDDVCERAKMLVLDQNFNNIINGAKLYKEQPLVFNGEQKQLDLLCERDDELVVVDYKSSDFAVEKNCEQVCEYVQILREVYPQKSVRGVIFFVLKNEIRYVCV